MGMINSIYHWFRPSGPQKAEHVGAVYADLVAASLVHAP